MCAYACVGYSCVLMCLCMALSEVTNQQSDLVTTNTVIIYIYIYICVCVCVYCETIFFH